MARRVRIGLREVRALASGEWLWDTDVTGFHARRRQSPTVTYGVFYRTAEGRQRFHKIGRHGAPWTPDAARAEARRILGVKETGRDPAAEKAAKRKAQTVNELCDDYWADAESGRLVTRLRGAEKAEHAAVGQRTDRAAHQTAAGHLSLAAVTRDDAERFMHAVAEGATAVRVESGRKRGLARVRGGRGTASRTVGLLGAIFTYASASGACRMMSTRRLGVRRGKHQPAYGRPLWRACGFLPSPAGVRGGAGAALEGCGLSAPHRDTAGH